MQTGFEGSNPQRLTAGHTTFGLLFTYSVEMSMHTKHADAFRPLAASDFRPKSNAYRVTLLSHTCYSILFHVAFEPGARTTKAHS